MTSKDCNNHCWHGTGIMLTSDPPQSEEICCHCGSKRYLRHAYPVPSGEHGPYSPHKEPAGGIRFFVHPAEVSTNFTTHSTLTIGSTPRVQRHGANDENVPFVQGICEPPKRRNEKG